MNVLETIIYPVIDQIQDVVKPGMTLEKSPSATLFGPDAPLDSLGLVNFIVAVEEAVEKQTGKSIRIVNESAMSRKKSPFRTISTFSEYIDELIKETA